jgi:hypothetical protein
MYKKYENYMENDFSKIDTLLQENDKEKENECEDGFI